MRIAIDAMGGDLGPRSTVDGVMTALTKHNDLEVIMFGPSQQLTKLVQESSPSPDQTQTSLSKRLKIVDAPQTVLQSASPLDVLDRSENSSLLSMLRAVKAGSAAAGVSCGNTGALMALARRELGSVIGISRPAISTPIPTRNGGRCYMLDLGASVDVHARHLVEYAYMGSLMAKAVDELKKPTVALLNVGVEAGKGAARVREADALLRSAPTPFFTYIGFIEGNSIFDGEVDVVVCDGFVGNAVLKASEGLAQMLLNRLQESFQSTWTTRILSALAKPALMRFKTELDPVRYNGASLLGLNHTIIKSHGNASASAFAFAIERALNEVRVGLPSYLQKGLVSSLGMPVISSVDDVDRVDSGSRNSAKSDDPSLQGWEQ